MLARSLADCTTASSRATNEDESAEEEDEAAAAAAAAVDDASGSDMAGEGRVDEQLEVGGTGCEISESSE